MHDKSVCASCIQAWEYIDVQFTNDGEVDTAVVDRVKVTDSVHRRRSAKAEEIEMQERLNAPLPPEAVKQSSASSDPVYNKDPASKAEKIITTSACPL